MKQLEIVGYFLEEKNTWITKGKCILVVYDSRVNCNLLGTYLGENEH